MNARLYCVLSCFSISTKTRIRFRRKARMHILVLASQKGGAGKTTLAAHLAVAAEAAGDGRARSTQGAVSKHRWDGDTAASKLHTVLRAASAALPENKSSHTRGEIGNVAPSHLRHV